VKVDNPEVAVVAEWDSVKDKHEFVMKDFSPCSAQAPQEESRVARLWYNLSVTIGS